MNFHQKRAAIKILILSLIIGVVIFTFFTVNWRGRGHFSQGYKSSSKLAYAKGISFVEYHGDKKVYAVSIDSFSVERARLGPFAIGPLHIAHLNKVAIDLYLDGIESKQEEENIREKISESGKIDLESPMLNIKKNLLFQIKKVKGIKINNISLNLWEKEERIFRISSDTATVDRKTGDLIFTGHATMDAGKNGKLQSHRIRWDRKTRLFKVIDPFYLTKGGKRIEGKGIETDYLLKRINYQVSNNK
jgi:hypothetical protein